MRPVGTDISESPLYRNYLREAFRLADVLGISHDEIPTWQIPVEGSFVTIQGGRLTLEGTERGHVTPVAQGDADEILYHVFCSIAFRLAIEYEVRHRRPKEDSRRQWFVLMEETMGKLKPDWQSRCAAYHAAILERAPFDDEPYGGPPPENKPSVWQSFRTWMGIGD